MNLCYTWMFLNINRYICLQLIGNQQHYQVFLTQFLLLIWEGIWYRTSQQVNFMKYIFMNILFINLHNISVKLFIVYLSLSANTPFVNKVVTHQPSHNIVSVSETFEPQKRGRGRPHKTSFDSPTISKTFKHKKHNQNTISDTINTPPTPIPGFANTLLTTQLRRYPLSDITSINAPHYIYFA